MTKSDAPISPQPLELGANLLHQAIWKFADAASERSVAEVCVDVVSRATHLPFIGVYRLNDDGEHYVAQARVSPPEASTHERPPSSIACTEAVAHYSANSTPLVGRELEEVDLGAEFTSLSSLVLLPIRSQAILAMGTPCAPKMSAQSIEFGKTIAELAGQALDRIAHLVQRETLQHNLDACTRHLRELVDLIPHFVYAHDLQGNFLLVNAAIAHRFDTSVDEIEKGALDDLLPSEDLVEEMLSQAHHVVETDDTLRYTRQMNFGGQQRDLDIVKRRLDTPLVDAPGCFCIAIDVTELNDSRRRLEKSRAKLKDTVARLERSNEALEQFAYAASHDLQEPLRMVSSFLGLIERKYADKLDDKGLSYINYAVDGAERMKQMIQGLLELSRVEHTNWAYENIDLHGLIADVERVLSAPIAQAQATIHTDDLPDIVACRVQLEQVLTNIIGNAVDHGGKNDIRIEVSCREDADHWIFSVQDDGRGIPKARQERVFDVFAKGSRTSTGCGIGLAVSRRLVEAMGGRIWVESEEGDGANFLFTIPKLAPQRLA